MIRGKTAHRHRKPEPDNSAPLYTPDRQASNRAGKPARRSRIAAATMTGASEAIGAQTQSRGFMRGRRQRSRAHVRGSFNRSRETSDEDQDQAFVTDFHRDVPRGLSSRYLSEQAVPQARWQAPEIILDRQALAYDPDDPGGKILVGAFGDKLIGIEDNRHILTVAGSIAAANRSRLSTICFHTAAACWRSIRKRNSPISPPSAGPRSARR